MAVYLAIANFAPRILVSYASDKGNVTGIARQLLTSEQLPTANQRVTYKATDKYKFHLLVDNGVRYLCLAERSTKRVFKLLEDVRDQFTAQFGDLGARATATDVDNITRLFRPVLADTLRDSAGDSSDTSDKIKLVQRGLEKVKDDAMRSIELAMTNTEHINQLEGKTEHLSLRASEFERASTRVARRMWWSSKKFQILMVLLFVAIVAILWAWFASGSSSSDD